MRVHALLDDASRFGVALRVFRDEREETMLSLLAQAILEHGKPDALYLDSVPRNKIEVLCPIAICGRLARAPRSIRR